MHAWVPQFGLPIGQPIANSLWVQLALGHAIGNFGFVLPYLSFDQIVFGSVHTQYVLE